MTSDLATTSLSLRRPARPPAPRLTPRPPGPVTVAIRSADRRDEAGTTTDRGRIRPRSRPTPAANVTPVDFLDPKHLIDTFGLAGLLSSSFSSRVIFPAPLPGDSLLFTAGLFAAADNKYDLHIAADRARRARVRGRRRPGRLRDRRALRHQAVQARRPVLQTRVRATVPRVLRTPGPEGGAPRPVHPDRADDRADHGRRRARCADAPSSSTT